MCRLFMYVIGIYMLLFRFARIRTCTILSMFMFLFVVEIFICIMVECNFAFGCKGKYDEQILDKSKGPKKPK